MPAVRHFVYLWSLENPVIIVPGPTGIVYCNQVDGLATLQRQLEGWLIPLPRIEAKVLQPGWWYRNLNHRTPGDEQEWGQVCREIESALSVVLSSGEAPTQVTVLPHPDNCEAWVHVSFLFPELGRDGSEDGRVPMQGVLTWENCD